MLDRAEPARERPTASRDPIRIRDPSSSTWSSVGFVQLQRAAGNGAVVRLLADRTRPISGLTAGQTVVQRASYAKKVAPDLAVSPIAAFRWMNGLNVDDLTDTMRALKKTPEHWAAVTKNWTMISGLDQPVWRMVRKVVETSASDAVQTETYRVHHFVRGEMWPQAWSTLSGAAELDRVVGLLDTLHLQAILPKLDTAGAGVDKVKVLTAMSMYTTLEGVAGSLDEATLRDVMQGHMIAQMHQVNTAGKSATSGVWYPYAYRASFPKEWAKHTDWKEGYADPAFFDRIGHMHWRLKAGASAADGIRSWLKGLTVAECATVMAVAMYESLLATIGKERFDKRFGGPGQPVAEAARLRIAQGPEISEPGTENRPPPLRQFIDDLAHGATPGGEPGQRNVKKGNWYYFRNHPDYTKKHPGGWLAGENTLCTDDTRGHQLFSGFGRTMEGVTEMTMLERASEAYNTPQSPEEKKAGATFDASKMTPSKILAAGGGILSKDVGVYDFDVKRVKRELE